MCRLDLPTPQRILDALRAHRPPDSDQAAGAPQSVAAFRPTAPARYPGTTPSRAVRFPRSAAPAATTAFDRGCGER